MILKDLIEQAPTLWKHWLHKIAAENAEPMARGRAVRELVAPQLARVTDLTARDLLAAEAAQVLGVKPSRVAAALRATRKKAGPNVGPAVGGTLGPGVDCTDMGNALRLQKYYGEDLLYCNSLGGWLIWDGMRWARDETEGIYRRAMATSQKIFDEVVGANGASGELADWAMESRKAIRLREMVFLARALDGIVAQPNAFDRDARLLNVQNGTVDLQTGELRPHRREDRITKVCPVAYEPEAEAPLWRACVNRWSDGETQLADWHQRVAGYTATGATREQCVFLHHGAGQNGKSTFLQALQDVLGDYGATSAAETFMVKREGFTGPSNDLAKLKGARMVFASEAEEGHRFAEALVKRVTGSERISARFLYKDFLEYRPEFKLHFGLNHLPNISGRDMGIWRRIRTTPWRVQIPDAEKDNELEDKLRVEQAGILAWVVEGAISWHHEGLAPPRLVTEYTDQYRSGQDVFGQWLQDCCVVGADTWAWAGDLYDTYRKWGGKWSQSAFGRELGNRGFHHVRRTGGRWVWEGVGVRTENG